MIINNNNNNNQLNLFGCNTVLNYINIKLLKNIKLISSWLSDNKQLLCHLFTYLCLFLWTHLWSINSHYYINYIWQKQKKFTKHEYCCVAVLYNQFQQSISKMTPKYFIFIIFDVLILTITFI